MGWDRRGYYYRVRKIDGRVVREYVGSGHIAALAARLDDIHRQEREAGREAWRAELAERDALDGTMNELNELADLLARAVLVAAGYRQHHRSEWRMKRARTDQAD